MALFSETLQSEIYLSDHVNQWRMLYLRIFGRDTEIARHFPKTMAHMGRQVANVWVSSVKPGHDVKAHTGHSKLMLRYLMALDLGGTNGEPGSTGGTTTDHAPGVYAQTLVWPDSTGAGAPYTKNWTTVGDDLLFDDTMIHGSITPVHLPTRVLLWLDIPRMDCSPLVNALIRFVLSGGLLHWAHPAVQEMTRKAAAHQKPDTPPQVLERLASSLSGSALAKNKTFVETAFRDFHTFLRAAPILGRASAETQTRDELLRSRVDEPWLQSQLGTTLPGLSTDDVYDLLEKNLLAASKRVAAPYSSGADQWFLHELVRDVLHTDTPGDFVEAGVYRGGALAVMAAALRHYGHGNHGGTPPTLRYYVAILAQGFVHDFFSYTNIRSVTPTLISAHKI